MDLQRGLMTNRSSLRVKKRHPEGTLSPHWQTGRLPRPLSVISAPA